MAGSIRERQDGDPFVREEAPSAIRSYPMGSLALVWAFPREGLKRELVESESFSIPRQKVIAREFAFSTLFIFHITFCTYVPRLPFLKLSCGVYRIRTYDAKLVCGRDNNT